MTDLFTAYDDTRTRMIELARASAPDALSAMVPACPDWTALQLITHCVSMPAALGAGDLRVVTNNLHVARILAANPQCEVVVAGGTVRHEDLGVVGEAALNFIRQFKVDIGLIGISGIDADGTLRDYDMREVMVARAIVEQSRQVWLVADHSKFDRPAMIEMAPLKVVHTLFTDIAPAPAQQRLMEDLGVRCVVATNNF